MTTLTHPGLRSGQSDLSVAAPEAARTAADYVRLERAYGARNYDPLPAVLSRGEGSWVTDVEGRRYLDLMSAYSAVSFGHAHPKIVAAFTEQAHRLAVTSRAYYNDRLPLLLERLTAITGLDRALPVNTGLEAVETAIKAARKWAHKVKGVAEGRAEIIACRGNFHGRSITITGLSTEAQYRDGFGPYPPGLKTIPFDDPAALEAAIGPDTAAFLVEPVQGEAGIVVPRDGYLARCREICARRRVLLICDEVQTGLGRTGHLFGWQHDGAKPDGVILGKALGGGMMPVSAFVATDDVMQVFHPGDHGSTFGGNPLGAAVALAALEVLEDERLVSRSRELGAWLLDQLRALDSTLVVDVRGRGLFLGIEVDPKRVTARQVVDRLLARGILSKDTHGTVIRIAPPLNVPREALSWAVGEIRDVLREAETGR
ncbi:MAG: ornithine--oxo-acid transaminase [Burkholderiales bacterium]|jgi:ornithine--oxo-acid transaminase|nr:ornithine--oxo-acid transaminase [Burkholderiales bacterium]